MKKRGLRKLLCVGLTMAMTLGLTACGGGKTVGADPALAKEYVYSYENIEIPDMGDDMTMRDIAKFNDRVYLIAEIHHWEETSQSNDYRLVSMNTDGSDMQSIEIELPIGAIEEEGNETGETSDVMIEATVEENTEDIATMDIAVEDAIIGDMSLGAEDYSQSYEYTGYNYFVIGENGTIYATREHFFEDYSDPENYISIQENSICAWDMDGKFLGQSPMENLQTEDSYNYISKLIPTQKGVTVLISGDSVSKIEVASDGTMSERKDLPNGQEILMNTADIMIKADGSLLVPHYNDDWTAMYLTEYDIETDTVGQESKLPDSFLWSGYHAMTSGISMDLVFSNAYGVFGLNMGDEQPVQIMSFINSDLNTNSLNQLVMLDETHFVGFYNDNVSYDDHAAIFTKKNPEDIPDKEVIVAGGVYISYDLKNRIIEFNKTNEKYRIVVREYESYNSADDYNAGTTQLNNDIISGKMPDILLADPTTLPMDSYIAKGLIADVGKLIEKDEELSQIEYLENVFKAYSVNDKLYYVIPNFAVQSMMGKASILGDKTGWNMQEFMEFVKGLPEGTQAIGELTRDGFMYYATRYCGNELVDVSTGKCNFNSPDFIAMLEYAKTLPEELSEEYYGEDYWMTYQSQYRDERTILANVYISSMRDMSYQMNGYFGEDVTFVGFPSETKNGTIICQHDGMYALSAKSKNLEGAWEFLRYYLTEEYQNSLEWGLPVAKQAFMDRAKEGMERPYYTDESGEKVEYDNYFDINGESVILDPLSQEQVDQVVEVILSANKLQYYNEDIQNIITEETAAFFEGQKSANDVAQIIQSRVQIFVDENR